MCYSHSPTPLLRVQNYANSSTVFNAASRVLEFGLPIYLASRLLRECLKIDLAMVLERILLSLRGDLLTNGVFPTAPVKPSTAMLLVAKPLACWATVDRKPDSMMIQRESLICKRWSTLTPMGGWSELGASTTLRGHHVCIMCRCSWVLQTQQADPIISGYRHPHCSLCPYGELYGNHV
jgi:hypothetical protein